MADGWKRSKDPFLYHSRECNLVTGKGIQACSCKPAIYTEPFATRFWDYLVENVPGVKDALK